MSSRFNTDRNRNSWRPPQQQQSRESSTASFRTANESFSNRYGSQQPPPQQRYQQQQQQQHQPQPQHRPFENPASDDKQRGAGPEASTQDSLDPPWQLELASIAKALRDRTANFLSVQAVPWDHGPHEIIEFGWSYPDPKQSHAPLEESLVTMHYVPQSGIKRRNGMLSMDARAYFLFGDHSSDLQNGDEEWNSARTVRTRLEDIVDRLEDTIRMLVKDKRPLYLVVHGSNRGVAALAQAAVNTADWGPTVFGTIENDDHVALDMNMDLSKLNALHQAARIAKDKERALAERQEWEDKMKKLRQPGDDRSREPDPYAPPQLPSRFNAQPSQNNAYGTGSRGNDHGPSSSSASAYTSSHAAQQGPSTSNRGRDHYDDDDGDYDEWGQPISDDEGIFDMPFQPAPAPAPQLIKKDPDVKILDTATLMKAIGYTWYQPDLNPNAKEPDDPTVKDMCKAIELNKSPYAYKFPKYIFDNAGNDAHYTILGLAEMCRQWVENIENRGQAAAAVPDIIRQNDALARETLNSLNVDARPSAPEPPRNVPVKRDNDGPSSQRKKPKADRFTSNSLETLIKEYDCLRDAWQAGERGEKTIAWIALDQETYEVDHNYTTEVGWSVLYPLSCFEIDMSGTRQGIVASHFIVEEHRHLRNYMYVPNNRDHFLMGSTSSETIDGAQKLENGSCVCPEPKIWAKLKRKLKQLGKRVDEIYLVFHDASADLAMLEQWEVLQGVEVLPFFDDKTGKHRVPQAKKGSNERRPIWLVDTQRLMRAYQHSKEVTSIKTMCEELVLDPVIANKRFHNAGNDAFYTLYAMKVMAQGPELPELRKKKQEERKVLPRGPRASAMVLQSWDQEYTEYELPGAKDEHTPLQAIQPEISTTPGSQERLRPLFDLSNSWYEQQCAYIAIRSVVVDGQVVELGWSVIDRRSISTQLDPFSSSASSSTGALPQPQRTYHLIDSENINLLSASGGHRFHKPYAEMQLDTDKQIVLSANNSEKLANGTIATTQTRMARQLRTVIANLRKSPGTVYFVFHGSVEDNPIPKLLIPNDQLPEPLRDSSRPTAATAVDDDDENKVADIKIFDSSLLFERYIEKVETVCSADAVLLDNTKPTLQDMCTEFNLLAGEQISLENTGNAAHLILRAVSYMSSHNPVDHAKGGPATTDPQEQIARLRALATLPGLPM